MRQIRERQPDKQRSGRRRRQRRQLRRGNNKKRKKTNKTNAHTQFDCLSIGNGVGK